MVRNATIDTDRGQCESAQKSYDENRISRHIESILIVDSAVMCHGAPTKCALFDISLWTSPNGQSTMLEPGPVWAVRQIHGSSC